MTVVEGNRSSSHHEILCLTEVSVTVTKRARHVDDLIYRFWRVGSLPVVRYSAISTRLDPWGHALAELGFVVPKHHGWPHSLTVTDGGRARYIVESRSSCKPRLLLTFVNTTSVYIGP